MYTNVSRHLAGLGLAACLIASVNAEPPIALHPDNPHYLNWRGEPTILLTSGEHYGALLNLDFDYVRYFDELQAHRLNHTRVFSGVYREVPSSFGITDNPLAPKPNRYICPWARSDQPGYSDGGNKFDLDRWDTAYFARLKDLMAEAQRRGIVVELTLFCPMYKEELWQACPMNAANNINGVGDCPRDDVGTLKHPDLVRVQLAVTRKIVEALRDFDNLYYEVCNEPYARPTDLAWQHRIIDAIVASERSFPHRHLISMNIANGRKKVVDPHPNVSILNFHYCVPPDTVALNFGLDRVIGENETGFRGRDDILYRTEAWDFLIAGGGLFNNLDYSFTPKHPAGTFSDYQSPGGGSRDLRRQLRILGDFLRSFDVVSMKPDNGVIRAIRPKLTASALVQRGKAYAVYAHVPLPNKPKDLDEFLDDHIEAALSIDLPAGTFQTEWINTKTGNVERREKIEHRGGNLDIRSPVFSNDIALRIVADASASQNGLRR